MVRHRLTIFVTFAITLLLLVPPTGAEKVGGITLHATFFDLAPLSSGHYEGWVITPDGPLSTGKFQVAQDGSLTDLAGAPLLALRAESVMLDDVSQFVLTIEPEGDNDAEPAAIKPLAGPREDSFATLTANLGVDFEDPAGSYILATPSNGPLTNERSGIWWLEDGAATLDIPDLTGTDWVYEGWVVIDGMPVSTGRFDHGAQADDGAPYSGMLDTPAFPGEDFLENAPEGLSFPTELRGTTAVISIEPRVDPDPAPFQFKPLVGVVPEDAEDHTSYAMGAMDLASGSVHFQPDQADTTPDDRTDSETMPGTGDDGTDVGDEQADAPGPAMALVLAALVGMAVLARRAGRT